MKFKHFLLMAFFLKNYKTRINWAKYNVWILLAPRNYVIPVKIIPTICPSIISECDSSNVINCCNKWEWWTKEDKNHSLGYETEYYCTDTCWYEYIGGSFQSIIFIAEFNHNLNSFHSSHCNLQCHKINSILLTLIFHYYNFKCLMVRRLFKYKLQHLYWYIPPCSVEMYVILPSYFNVIVASQILSQNH